jgi:chloramphenicol O-acetyltransferase
MKRMLQFEYTDTGYACFEKSEKVFEISKTDLQFDVKAFYQAFYSEDKDYDDIEVENCIPEDKDARRVYECIVQLMTKIKEKLAEMPADTEENSSD